MLTGHRAVHQHRQIGQAAVIVALAFLVLLGFAGLAIDGGHVYLVHRTAQNATDAAALGAGKQLAAGGVRFGPLSPGDPALKAAHDVAYVNGFATAYSASCSSSGTITVGGASVQQYSTTWYDSGAPCGSTSGFATSVTVNSPPSGRMSTTCTAAYYYCVQVVVTRKIDNFLMGVLGVPVTYSTTSATAFAQPPKGGFNTPPPVALYLYEPGSGCTDRPQCFSTSRLPSRQQLSCSPSLGSNCPTFWVRPGSRPLIAGVNASIIPTRDTVALESNGHMVVQDNTTICDPYGGACSPGALTGALGFAIAPGATLYCSGSTPAALAPVPCTTAGPAGAPLATLTGNETGFSSLLWSPSTTFNGPICGSLVLNGGTVSSGGVNSACVKAAEPYTIQPGQYNYIVINHGTYEFDPGLYDIIGAAPTSGVIDHTAETSADWDLCGGAPACNATAGVWIGQSGPAVAGQFPTGGTCSGLQQAGGGGFDTVITGPGVTFRFRGSGGFVSTHEVASIVMTAPGPGAALTTTAGAPLLFDLENNAFIHLDANPNPSLVENPTPPAPSRFSGIIYQTPGARSGGVEVNPGLGGSSAAIAGQVLAYSFTTFGSPGSAIDFSQGYGSSSAPVVVPNANAEPEIVGSPAPYLQAGPTAGTEQLVITYFDEWALDAYNAYVKINNGAPQFFSQGMWQVPVGPGTPLPPNPNDGGVSDLNPAYPNASQPGASNYTIGATSTGLPDWTYKYTDGSTFEVRGNWTWGHEQDIRRGASRNNVATLIYTFPTPVGTTVNITVYMSDGDSCGDFAIINTTFNNVGAPGSGQQSAGSVRLEQ